MRQGEWCLLCHCVAFVTDEYALLAGPGVRPLLLGSRVGAQGTADVFDAGCEYRRRHIFFKASNIMGLKVLCYQKPPVLCRRCSWSECVSEWIGTAVYGLHVCVKDEGHEPGDYGTRCEVFP